LKKSGAVAICSAHSARGPRATPHKPDINTLIHVKKMSNRRSGSAKRTLTIPKRIRPTPGIELERLSLAQQHKSRTLSLLGQAIKIKAVEFLPGVHNPGAETALDFIAKGIEIACDQLGLEIDTGLAPGATPIIGQAASSADFFSAGIVAFLARGETAWAWPMQKLATTCCPSPRIARLEYTGWVHKLRKTPENVK
jgi:hypothetical protein